MNRHYRPAQLLTFRRYKAYKRNMAHKIVKIMPYNTELRDILVFIINSIIFNLRKHLNMNDEARSP